MNDRIREVKLYINLGRRASATIRQLNYPTKNALKIWYWEFEKRNVLAIDYSRSKSKYSDEQKKVAVEHYLSHDFCIAATARALGYPETEPLRARIREMHSGEVPILLALYSGQNMNNEKSLLGWDFSMD